METKERRTSDRIELEIPIEVVGLDFLGSQFFERTCALVIGQCGGKIGLGRVLVPAQEVTIRCLATSREADARIIGQIATTMGVHYYGIKFLHKDDNIWGIEFLPLTEFELAGSRVLLECIGCKSREACCLDDFELEILEVTGHLSHPCKLCRNMSFWRKSREGILESEIAPSASSPPVPIQRQDQRREPRREMGITACVSTARFGQDLVRTQTVSRHGLSFTSSWEYVPGDAIEVAVPYSPGGGNIFMPAKIVRLQLLASAGTRIYGVAFQHLKD